MKSELFLISPNCTTLLRKTIFSQKIYKTPQNIDLCFEHRGFVLFETRTRYVHQTDLKRRENGFQVNPRLKVA